MLVIHCSSDACPLPVAWLFCLQYVVDSPQTLTHMCAHKHLNRYIAWRPEHRCFSVWLAASEACSPSWLKGYVNPHRSSYRQETHLSEGFILCITPHQYSICQRNLQLISKWIHASMSPGDCGQTYSKGKESKYPSKNWLGHLQVRRHLDIFLGLGYL